MRRSRLIGQRRFWWKPIVFATRSVSEGLYLTRSLAYASDYYFGNSGAVQLINCFLLRQGDARADG